jgi:hypothetical protein
MDLPSLISTGSCALTRLGPCHSAFCVAWYSIADAAILGTFFVFWFRDTAKHEGRRKAIRYFLPIGLFVVASVALCVYLAMGRP